MPAALPPSGMKGWGLVSAFSSLQCHGMSAEPGPAPTPRGGASPAHFMGFGRGAPRDRRRTARKQADRAAVRILPAPLGRYCPPRPAAPDAGLAVTSGPRPDRPSPRGGGGPPASCFGLASVRPWAQGCCHLARVRGRSCVLLAPNPVSC